MCDLFKILIMNRLENSRDLDRLIEAMADKKVVMLGEASHGTHEYYTWRTEISKRLIEEHGFSVHRRRRRLARLL